MDSGFWLFSSWDLPSLPLGANPRTKQCKSRDVRVCSRIVSKRMLQVLTETGNGDVSQKAAQSLHSPPSLVITQSPQDATGNGLMSS
jgi:hypothetical protein